MRRSGRWIGSAFVCMVTLAGCGAGGADGDGSLAEVRWDRTAPESGRVVDGAVLISGPSNGGTFPLTTIVAPKVGGDGYAIVGRVRYEGLVEPAYLEMWSVFPDGGRYFSRTLGTDGPLAALVGDSGWRPFQLPFFLEGGSAAPTHLELNAVVASAGRVWVGPLRLVSIGDAGSSGAWWTDRTAGLVGGIGGAVVGILGGMIGTFASRGKARRLVLGTMVGLVALGAVLLVAGVVALFDSQPYGVTGSLFLGGVILVAVVGSMIPTARRAYAQVELRRMRALDAA